MMPTLRKPVRFCAFGLTLALGACATGHSFNSVEIARTALIGFTEDDVRMCAGFPSRTTETGNSSIWSYESRESSGGLSLSAPILLGAGGTTNLTLPSGGSCRAQFRFVDGRVDRLSYAGDNDSPRGRDTLCTPIVDDCLTYARTYGKGSLPKALEEASEAEGMSPAVASEIRGSTTDLRRMPGASR